MGSTSRRDDGYSRSLSPPDTSLPYSSRPSDQAQTGRPSRSGKSKGQSQNNNQSTDVPPQQSLVPPPMQLPLSYSDYMRQKLETATGSGPVPSSSRTNESQARPPENRTTAVTMAPPNSYPTTARRNDTVRRDVELETRPRGGQQRPGQHPLDEAMTRKDMSPPEPYHSSQPQYHVQPFTGYIVTTTPVNLPMQPTTLPANFQQGDVLGHGQQPPPYEPRAHPPTQGRIPSGSRTPEQPRPVMSSPPGLHHGGGPSASGWPGPYQAGQPNPTSSPRAPIGLQRTDSTADRSQQQQPPQNPRASNDTSRHRPPIEHHPTPPSNDTTRNDRRAPHARESRDTFDRHPGPSIELNTPMSPPPAVLPTANNIRGRPSNSYLSIPESSAGIRPGETTSTPSDQRYPPPPSQSRPPVNRQPSPQPPLRVPPNPNPARVVERPKRKGVLAALCSCGGQ